MTTAAPTTVFPVIDVTGAPRAEAWVHEHRGDLRAMLDRDGVALVRGLDWHRPGDVADVVRALGSTPTAEREAFAPRAARSAGTYGPAEWPSDQPMCPHHELSYRDEVPALVVVGCLRAPASGGATPVADARAVLADLPGDVVDGFVDGWTLTRTFGGDLGVSAAEAFGSADPDAVAAYCAAHDITRDPGNPGVLRTRQHRAAVVRHPRTGEPVWFNQIAFCNSWTMDPLVREYLLDTYGPDGLPFDTAHADGTPVASDTVDAINAAYERHARREPWRDGDLLLIDNIRIAHGRDPYRGVRDMVVVFADPTAVRPS